MSKVAIIVLADTTTHEALGRVVNALEAVKELKQANDDVRIVFDGAGTKWPGELARTDHKAHGLWEATKSKTFGACKFCAGAFEATSSLESAGVKSLDEYEGHPSFKRLIDAGYTVITF